MKERLMYPPGRKPPFECYFSKHGEEPPMSVSRLTADAIIIETPNGFGKELRKIPFQNSGALWENDDLAQKLFKLSTDGVPFLFCPKDMCGPDSLMIWWQETGKLKLSFELLSWRFGGWDITIIPPPTIGALGWDGPKPFGH
jgi:hypothetical protein